MTTQEEIESIVAARQDDEVAKLSALSVAICGDFYGNQHVDGDEHMKDRCESAATLEDHQKAAQHHYEEESKEGADGGAHRAAHIAHETAALVHVRPAATDREKEMASQNAQEASKIAHVHDQLQELSRQHREMTYENNTAVIREAK